MPWIHVILHSSHIFHLHHYTQSQLIWRKLYTNRKRVDLQHFLLSPDDWCTVAVMLHCGRLINRREQAVCYHHHASSAGTYLAAVKNTLTVLSLILLTRLSFCFIYSTHSMLQPAPLIHLTERAHKFVPPP